MTSTARALLLPAMAALLTGGCIVVTTANIYDTCSGTEQCPGVTVCQAANVTTNGFTGTFCTVSCGTSADCPSDGTGIPPICVVDTSTGVGLCYAGCPNNTGCPYAEVCATDPYATAFFCVP